ncbi:MAG TPA: FeoB-associated Cys-rich membrane protein [Candidatus Merdenecus merdavium]|nr:FeoB-associated Cys-rich membrane protein [Candidatus Merdenecus merdavium]
MVIDIIIGVGVAAIVIGIIAKKVYDSKTGKEKGCCGCNGCSASSSCEKEEKA